MTTTNMLLMLSVCNGILNYRLEENNLQGEANMKTHFCNGFSIRDERIVRQKV